MSWLHARGVAFDRWRSRRAGPPPALPDGTPTTMTKLESGTVRTLLVPRPDGAAGPAARPTVVLVPDPPHGIEHVLPLVARLRDDFPVAVFEVPGFGWSTASSRFDWSTAALARCFHEFLAAHGFEDAVLAAPCILGLPAVHTASEDPQRIRGLLLEQTPDLAGARDWVDRVDRDRFLRRPLLGQGAAAAAESRIVRIWYETAEPDPAQRATYTRLARDRKQGGGVFCLASALQAIDGLDPARGLPPAPPTIILWGLDDRSWPEPEVERVMDRWPDATLIPLEDAGHFPGLSHPDVFVEAVHALAAGKAAVDPADEAA